MRDLSQLVTLAPAGIAAPGYEYLLDRGVPANRLDALIPLFDLRFDDELSETWYNSIFCGLFSHDLISDGCMFIHTTRPSLRRARAGGVDGARHEGAHHAGPPHGEPDARPEAGHRRGDGDREVGRGVHHGEDLVQAPRELVPRLPLRVVEVEVEVHVVCHPPPPHST